MQRDAKLQIQNETLEETPAKTMVSRFRVRSGQQSNQRNLTRQFRARQYWRRANREQTGARLLPCEYIGQVKLKSRVFSSLWTPNGKYLISAPQGHLVRVIRGDAIDSKTNSSSIIKKRIPIGQEGWSILDLALSPDSSQGAIVAWGDVIHLFDINDDDHIDTTRVPLPDFLVCRGSITMRFSALNTRLTTMA